MSTQPSEKSPKATGGTKSSSPAPRGDGVLVTKEGKTAISDGVVAKIAGTAAREVTGVYAMGAGFSRALGAVRERMSGGSSSVTQGISVEVGETQAAVDLDLVVEYGVSIPDVAAGVRRNVIGAVEKMCGLEVSEVNITVGDIHLPEEESAEASESRVQ